MVKSIFSRFILYGIFLNSIGLSCGQNQLKIKVMKAEELPKEISFKGKFKNAVYWEDKNGKNIALITETGEYPSINEKYEDYRDAELYGYHFLMQDNSIRQIWKINDYIKDCPVDIEANFIKDIIITDINMNGIAEIWLIYKIACHGDVSPPVMKIIMYEGKQKFAMRGTRKVKISESEYEGGEYEFDLSFKKGPTQFKQFAQNLWKENLLENWK